MNLEGDGLKKIIPVFSTLKLHTKRTIKDRITEWKSSQISLDSIIQCDDALNDNDAIPQ